MFRVIDEVTRQPVDLPEFTMLQTQDLFIPPYPNLLLAQDDRERSIDHRVAPILDDDDRIIGLIFLFRDITERRRLEAELLRADKFESISNLAGGIAHDFNNLLTVIWANMILASLDADCKDIVVEKITAAQKTCKEAMELTQQLLTFSKGGRPVKNLLAIDKILLDAARTSGNSMISIATLISENLWLVNIDENQISRVMGNLLSNAVQAMPQGGKITVQAENIVITVKSNLPLKSGNYLRITITDQGHGIPKKYLDKIFDPFFSTTKKAAGMGLTVAHAIIKNHAGYLTVESEMGMGTAVSFYLPATLPSLESAWITRDLIITKHGKVLLMDDDDMILDVIGIMMEKLGYTVALAKNGAAALELFKLARQTEKPFDAVILDSVVPGHGGGLETLTKMREIDPQVKAIICSGYADDPVMSDFAKYGFCGKLPKPYRITKLSEMINKILKSDHS